MQTLEELLQTQEKSAQKFTASRYDEDGKLKRATFYGNEQQKPLEAGGVFVWVGGEYSANNPQEELGSLKQMLDSIFNAFPSAKSYITNGHLRNMLAGEYPGKVVDAHDEASSGLAVSQIVVSIGMLPRYFRKREGQRHVHVVASAEFGKTRYERATYGISSLLCTDVICVASQDALEEFVRQYQLRGAYAGKLVVAEASQVAQVVQDVQKGLDDIEGIRVLSDKKRVLIFTDCDYDITPQKYCKHLLSLIDFDVYDVTLMLQSYKKATTAKMLCDAVDERVRVVERTGSFSCDLDSFVAVQVINDCMLDQENALEVASLVPADVMRGEMDRLLYGMEFDTFMYCAAIRNMWLLTSSYVPARRKVFVELDYSHTAALDGSNEQRTRRYVNYAQLKASIFDVIVCANSEMVEFLAEYAGEENCLAWQDAVPYPLDTTAVSANESAIQIAGRTYQLLDEQIQGDGVRHLSLVVAKPEDDVACYAARSRALDIPRAIEMGSHLPKGSILYLFIENKGLASSRLTLPNIPANITLIDCSALEGYQGIAQLLAGFDGIVEFDMDDSVFWRLVNALDLTRLRLTDGFLEIDESHQAMSNEEYAVWCDKMIENLILGQKDVTDD